MGEFRIGCVGENIQIEVPVFFPEIAARGYIQSLLLQISGHTSRDGNTGIALLDKMSLSVKNRHMTGADPFIAFFPVISVVFGLIVFVQLLTSYENTFIVVVQVDRIRIHTDDIPCLAGQKPLAGPVDS